MEVFHLNDICMDYASGEAAVHALRHVNISIGEKEKIAIVGASGSGKSTLLNVLSGLEKPTAGEVIYEGKNLYKNKEAVLSNIRLKEFGFVFQSFYLVSSMTVRDNIILPSVMAYGKPNEELYEELVAELGLGERVLHYPSQLSGGERQRVAIARALINRPKVVFADEPSGNLDSQNGNNVFELLFRMADKYEQTLIYVTHDMEKAELAGRRIMIKDGGIQA